MARNVVERLRHEGEPIKGSRFIATVVPVTNEAVAKEALAAVRAEMPDAGHHCSAWRLAAPAVDRASDDGEPGGSAGRPILAQLVGRELVNTAVIVSRFWGGTKLGVGGLVRAYGGAAGLALDRADTVLWVVRVGGVLTHDHGDTDAVVRAMAAGGAHDVDVSYDVAVTRLISTPLNGATALSQAIADGTSGRAQIRFDDHGK